MSSTKLLHGMSYESEGEMMNEGRRLTKGEGRWTMDEKTTRSPSLIPHPSSLVPLLLALTLACSCGSANSTGEDYGDLLNSPSGLTLTQEEHQSGWGKSTCNTCHIFNNIHISLSESGYDMAAVRDSVSTDGLSSCATCHGGNGVE